MRLASLSKRSAKKRIDLTQYISTRASNGPTHHPFCLHIRHTAITGAWRVSSHGVALRKLALKQRDLARIKLAVWRPADDAKSRKPATKPRNSSLPSSQAPGHRQWQAQSGQQGQQERQSSWLDSRVRFEASASTSASKHTVAALDHSLFAICYGFHHLLRNGRISRENDGQTGRNASQYGETVVAQAPSCS